METGFLYDFTKVTPSLHRGSLEIRLTVPLNENYNIDNII